MNNIKIIRTGINVSKIVADLKKYPEDWQSQETLQGAKSVVDEFGFPKLSVGVLQLVMGGVETPQQYVGDTEYCIDTPAIKRHNAIVGFLKRWFPEFRRCGFLALPVGGVVGQHIDKGTYYLTKDRYHLSIQGRYKYTVGDESVIVEPGTLLWFNNKLPHGAENVGDETRVTFVFDVPHSKKNPK